RRLRVHQRPGRRRARALGVTPATPDPGSHRDPGCGLPHRTSAGSPLGRSAPRWDRWVAMPRRLPNHPDLTVRLIRDAGKPALLDLFGRLTPLSRTRRFLAPKPTLSRRELAYFTELDQVRHAAFVAVAPDGSFAGVARYACAVGETEVADVAFAVADAWQGQG